VNKHRPHQTRKAGVPAGHPDAYGKSEDLTDDGQGRNLVVGCLIVKGGLTPKRLEFLHRVFQVENRSRIRVPKGGMNMNIQNIPSQFLL